MLTAFTYPLYREASLEAGADFFLLKATEFEKVAGVVRQLAAEKQNLK